MGEKIKRKVCKVCGELKLVTDFYNDFRASDLLRSECKQCTLQANKRSRDKNKEQISRQNKGYYELKKKTILNHVKLYQQTDAGKATIARHQHRRRRLKLDIKTDVNLTNVEWQKILNIQKYKCNICGKKFTKTRPATRDHIIPLAKGGGFTSSNVQALCRSCNSTKSAKILKGFINSWCL